MRAFISSTYSDLIDHRRAVAEALERLGIQPQRMETFGARAEDATQASLAEIGASEIFVGIYAKRYGYVPTNSDISITEAEFDYAFNLRRPTFCFFVDEEYPWPHQLVETEPGASLLSRFKARVEALVVRDYFTTADVLAGRVASSIGRYLLADPAVPPLRLPTGAPLPQQMHGAFVDVWRSLSSLLRAGNELWRHVSDSTLASFADTLRETDDLVVQHALFFSDDEYDTLVKILRVANFYLGGKEWLSYIRNGEIYLESMAALS